jgi:hypothetical protein
MCTLCMHYIHPPTHFPHLLTPPTGINQGCPVPPSCSQILQKKKKNYHICLFKIATQGVSFLVVPAYIHIYILHTYILFIIK